MSSVLECTNCGFPLESGLAQCPYCNADLSLTGATVRRLPRSDIIAPAPGLETPRQPDPVSSEPAADEAEFESTYELDAFVPFDDAQDAQPSTEGRRHSPALRAAALVSIGLLVISLIGTTGWFAFQLFLQH